MNGFHPLLPEWRARLRMLEGRIEAGSRLSWLWHIRARTLRYLINRYGREWTEHAEIGAMRTPGLQRSFFRVRLPFDPGGPPKSRDEIRSRLRRIHYLYWRWRD